MSDDSSSSGGCGSFLSLILIILICGAFWFGITVRGKHYNPNCNCTQGIEIIETRRP